MGPWSFSLGVEIFEEVAHGIVDVLDRCNVEQFVPVDIHLPEQQERGYWAPRRRPIARSLSASYVVRS